jgi:hypothetical protein
MPVLVPVPINLYLTTSKSQRNKNFAPTHVSARRVNASIKFKGHW